MLTHRMLALAALFALAGPGNAADDAPAKQQAAAEANLKAAKLTLGKGETDHLLLFAAYPDAKVHAMAATAEKTYMAATKVLKLKDDDVTGKVAITAVPDAKAYKVFVLQALKRSPRPKEVSDLKLRGETPYVVFAPTGGKPTADAVAAEAGELVASGLLSVKAGIATGSELPGWLEQGFGRAIGLHADGNAAKLTAHKAKVRALAGKTAGRAFQFTYVWGDAAGGAEFDTLATSFADYLAYGPGADKFAAFLGGFKPAEGNDSPGVDDAFRAADWKMNEVEAAWKRWAITGK